MKTAVLEKERDRKLQELQQIGEMRSGSLSERYQRCGRKPCICNDPRHPGHGPLYSYSVLVDGKTKIQNYKPGPALERLRKELAAYQRFRALTHEIIAVSTALCVAREMEEGEEEQEKKKLQKRSGKNSRRK